MTSLSKVFPSRLLLLALLTSFLSRPSLLMGFGDPPSVAWSTTLAGVTEPAVSKAPGGGVYVTARGSFPLYGRLFRLDSTGQKLWEHTLGNSLYPSQVATDVKGNALVLGTSHGSAFLRKHLPNGNLDWHREIDSPLWDEPSGIAVDTAGNSYASIAPSALNNGLPPDGTLHTLQGYNRDGNLNWIEEFDTQDGTYPGNAISWSSGAAIDGDGNIVTMFNNYPAPHNGAFNSYLSKTTSDGQVLWVKRVGAFSNVFSIDTDSENNIYAALNDRILKVDTDGNEVWTVDNEAGQIPNLSALTIGPGDRVFVGGQVRRGVHPSGALHNAPYMAEYDVAGNLIWSDVQNVGLNEATKIHHLTVSRRQLIGVANVTRNNGYSDTFVLAYGLIPEPGTASLAAVALMLTTFRRRVH